MSSALSQLNQGVAPTSKKSKFSSLIASAGRTDPCTYRIVSILSIRGTPLPFLTASGPTRAIRAVLYVPSETVSTTCDRRGVTHSRKHPKRQQRRSGHGTRTCCPRRIRIGSDTPATHCTALRPTHRRRRAQQGATWRSATHERPCRQGRRQWWRTHGSKRLQPVRRAYRRHGRACYDSGRLHSLLECEVRPPLALDGWPRNWRTQHGALSRSTPSYLYAPHTSRRSTRGCPRLLIQHTVWRSFAARLWIGVRQARMRTPSLGYWTRVADSRSSGGKCGGGGGNAADQPPIALRELSHSKNAYGRQLLLWRPRTRANSLSEYPAQTLNTLGSASQHDGAARPGRRGDWRSGHSHARRRANVHADSSIRGAAVGVEHVRRVRVRASRGRQLCGLQLGGVQRAAAPAKGASPGAGGGAASRERDLQLSRLPQKDRQGDREP